MSKMQRTKGAVFEREVAEVLSLVAGYPVKRTLGQARDGGADIELHEMLVECKRRKSLKVLYGWWSQVNRCGPVAAGAKVPAMVIRADNEEALFVCALSELAMVARMFG